MEKLSVIIPVYNVSKYLEKCLDSVLAQTYTNLEIICINDGSTDNSAAILAAYAQKDPRIIVIDQENSGPSITRNNGIKQATGTLLTFLDSDDFINPETYQLCIPLFQLNVDVVFFGCKVVAETNAIKWDSDDDYYSVHQDGLVELTPQILLYENVSPCNKIYKTAVILEKQIYFPEHLLYEDAEFYWKYMANAQNAYFIQNKVYNYLRRNNSTMANTFRGTDKAKDHLKVLDNILTYFGLNIKYDHFMKKVAPQLFESYFWFSYQHAMPEQRKDILQMALNIIAKYQLRQLFPENKFIKNMVDKKYHKYKNIDEYSFAQKIFSIKKMQFKKYVYISGFKFELERKKYKKLKSLLDN